MTSAPLHIGDRVTFTTRPGGRRLVGVLRSISHTDAEMSVEIEIRNPLNFDTVVGWIHGSPHAMEVTRL